MNPTCCSVTLQTPRQIGKYIWPNGRVVLGYSWDGGSFFITSNPLLESANPPTFIHVPSVVPDLEDENDGDDSPFDAMKFYPYPNQSAMLVVAGMRFGRNVWGSYSIYVFTLASKELKLVVEGPGERPHGDVIIPDQNLADGTFTIAFRARNQRIRKYSLESWNYVDYPEKIRLLEHGFFDEYWRGEPFVLGNNIYLTAWEPNRPPILHNFIWRHGEGHQVETKYHAGEMHQFKYNNSFRLAGHTIYALCRQMLHNNGWNKLDLWKMDPSSFTWSFVTEFRVDTKDGIVDLTDFNVDTDKGLVTVGYSDYGLARIFYLPISDPSAQTQVLIDTCRHSHTELKKTIDPTYEAGREKF